MAEGLSVRDMLDSRRLPVPQTQVAQRLQAKLPEISQLLIGVDPAQFASACICEANMLRLTLSPEEINEPALIPKGGHERRRRWPHSGRSTWPLLLCSISTKRQETDSTDYRLSRIFGAWIRIRPFDTMRSAARLDWRIL